MNKQTEYEILMVRYSATQTQELVIQFGCMTYFGLLLAYFGPLAMTVGTWVGLVFGTVFVYFASNRRKIKWRLEQLEKELKLKW